MAADVVKTSSAKAVSGDTLTIASRDGGVTVSGAKVVKTDIGATNGVIHVIRDRSGFSVSCVLLPTSATKVV